MDSWSAMIGRRPLRRHSRSFKMAALSYGTAARIATRELHSSRGKFTFVILSVAIGVAALTGVRGFSASFRSMLTLRARSIMAGDLSAKGSQQPSPAEPAGVDTI